MSNKEESSPIPPPPPLYKISVSRKSFRPVNKTLKTIKQSIQEKDTLTKSVLANSPTRKARETIGRFFKKTGTPRQARFLSIKCPDSGQCITFGKEIPKIKEYFNNFDTDFIMDNEVRRIGKLSVNGFVTEIPYKHGKYAAYCVLKSSVNNESDNLLYEAFVGCFINKKNLVYPCFVETYKVCFYNDLDLYENLLQENDVSRIDFQNGLIENNKTLDYSTIMNPLLIGESCEYSMRFSILIQHIKNAKTIKEHMSSFKYKKDFFTVHLINYLFQIYCPLAYMSNMFTHYDLHTENVLIYQIPDGKYIRMVYHYPDNTTVEFNTTGISKIIDYGHSYINDEAENVTSKKFVDIVCEAEKCNNIEEYCGDFSGYQWLLPEETEGESHYISGQKRNKSHDLRLLNMIHKTPEKYNGINSKYIRNLLSRIEYEGMFGTPEIESSISEYKFSHKIRNVEEAHLSLKHLILEVPYFKSENDRIFSTMPKLGELHIWVDGTRNVEYTPLKI